MEVEYSSVSNKKYDGITIDGYKDYFKSLEDGSTIKGCGSITNCTLLNNGCT